jgi:hypothetical protein
MKQRRPSVIIYAHKKLEKAKHETRKEQLKIG